jgi:thioredoxin-related protein
MMILQSAKTALFTTLFGFTLFAIYALADKIMEKKNIQQQIQSLPVDKIRSLDSTLFVFPRAESMLIIYFNSTCEHCQYELKEIREHAALFDGTHLLLVSSENMADIRTFSLQSGLTDRENVSFAKINPDDVYDTFGSVSIPHIFIYNNAGSLVKEFKGETKVEAIAKSLP